MEVDPSDSLEQRPACTATACAARAACAACTLHIPGLKADRLKNPGKEIMSSHVICLPPVPTPDPTLLGQP